MTKPNINEAAEVVMTAEKNALINLLTALETLEASLAEIDATLPQSFSMDARRMVGEIRSTMAYRRSSEIPQLLNKYEAPSPLPAPSLAGSVAMPEYNPNA